MKESVYRTALLYTPKATQMAFAGLVVASALQVWLIAQSWVVLSGFTTLVWLSVLIMLVLLSNLTAGFVLVEMLRDSDQYRPRFARAGWMHGLMTAGVCATMLIQLTSSPTSIFDRRQRREGRGFLLQQAQPQAT